MLPGDDLSTLKVQQRLEECRGEGNYNSYLDRNFNASMQRALNKSKKLSAWQASQTEKLQEMF